MKTTPKQYALALYESVEEKDEKETERIIKNFVHILISTRKMSQAEKIIGEFSILWNKKRNVVDAEITSAKVLGERRLSILRDHIKKTSGADVVVVRKKEDENLLGGFVIRYQDKIFDGSLKTQIISLREDMKK